VEVLDTLRVTVYYHSIDNATATEPNMTADIAHLAPLAKGLDLNASEDRAVFRCRVADAVRITRVSAIREWLNGDAPVDRVSAARKLADAYINSAQHK
jgi:hypothetical protein